jgi:hypothetical protein
MTEFYTYNRSTSILDKRLADIRNRQNLSDKILPSWPAFVVSFPLCRNNSENISPKYLESAEICRIFAPVSLTI